MTKKNKNINWIKKVFFVFLFFFLIFFFVFILFFNKKTTFSNIPEDNFLNRIFETKVEKMARLQKVSFLEKIKKLKENQCQIITWGSKKDKCYLENKLENCLNENNYYWEPLCYRYKINHIKRPENVRTLYYSAYGASSSKKIDWLIELSKISEINSVVIDIKETNGKVYLNFENWEYQEVKPEVDNIIRNPKKLIEKLHQNNIYVIGRIVLFKDKSLAFKRPDLAVKKNDKKTVWKDYSGKKWVDPNSKEVWNYNLEIARQTYLLGFDEINIDYVRFPTDGPMNNIYYPFSQGEINNDKKWGRAKILDNFYYYFTKKLRDEFPEINISIDVFGQVAINYDDVSIGQILSSALLYFDAVSPMSYPSHYAWNFVPFPDGPDNHPYEVIDKTYRKAIEKINFLNSAISDAKSKKERVLLRPNFWASLEWEEVQEIKKIESEKIRPWYQAFNCTWCRSYKIYGKKEIQEQIEAGKNNGLKSWMLWNASSRYSSNLFDKVE